MSSNGNPRPVFVAALPREIGRLVKGWQTDEALLARKIHLYWNDNAVIVCAGMGVTRVQLAVQAALAVGPASELISVGWAGACRPQMQVGDLVRPDVVVDAKTGERLFAQKQRRQMEGLEVLVTVPVPASPAEKARLGESYYAAAVDMEAVAVARAAQRSGLPFRAIKAISDGADFELPALAAYSTPDGQFREASFGIHVATHPSLWRSVRTLAKGSKLAAERLQDAIEEHIQQARRSK